MKKIRLIVVVLVFSSSMLFASGEKDVNSDGLSDLLIMGTAENEMDAIRIKWSEYLVGDIKELEKESSQGYVLGVSNRAEQLVASANTEARRAYMWENLKYIGTKSDQVVSTIRNIYAVLLAYKTPGTVQYGDAEILSFIREGLDWFFTTHYTDSGNSYGNWWSWEIGAAKTIGDTLCLLYDELSKEEMDRYIACLKYRSKKIDLSIGTHTGGNLADRVLVKVLTALMTKDEFLLTQSVDYAKTLLKYTQRDDLFIDGFYRDGSYIQHHGVAYIGSYGSVLLDQLGTFFYLFGNTRWNMMSPIVYEWVYNAIVPIIYKGEVFESVRGRAVSRSNQDAADAARALTLSLIKISFSADGENKEALDRVIKTWLVPNKDNFFRGNPASILNIAATEILDNRAIKVVEPLRIHYAMNSMDRSVHEREDYTFVLARTSTRVKKNGSLNDEDITAWYRGDGMNYLYIDKDQYTDSYWPTQDPYSVPGVIRIVRDRVPILGRNSAADVSLNEYSGGISLDAYGSAAMTIGNPGENLLGQRSWFMFDDEIVFINTGVTDDSGNEVVSTIENRRLFSNTTTMVNGSDLTTFNGVSKSFYIDAGGTSIGYYFPTAVEVDFSVVAREGSWNAVDGSRNQPTVYTDDYALMTYSYGVGPNKASLVYYMLPNIREGGLQNYENDDPITLLEVSEDVHAVSHDDLDILAINFFSDSGGSFKGISANTEIMFMQKENNGVYDCAISDPMFSDRAIAITIDGVVAFDVSEGLVGQLDGEQLTVTVDPFSKDRGNVFYFSYTPS